MLRVLNNLHYHLLEFFFHRYFLCDWNRFMAQSFYSHAYSKCRQNLLNGAKPSNKTVKPGISNKPVDKKTKPTLQHLLYGEVDTRDEWMKGRVHYLAWWYLEMPSEGPPFWNPPIFWLAEDPLNLPSYSRSMNEMEVDEEWTRARNTFSQYFVQWQQKTKTKLMPVSAAWEERQRRCVYDSWAVQMWACWEVMMWEEVVTKNPNDLKRGSSSKTTLLIAKETSVVFRSKVTLFRLESILFISQKVMTDY